MTIDFEGTLRQGFLLVLPAPVLQPHLLLCSTPMSSDKDLSLGGCRPSLAAGRNPYPHYVARVDGKHPKSCAKKLCWWQQTMTYICFHHAGVKTLCHRSLVTLVTKLPVAPNWNWKVMESLCECKQHPTEARSRNNCTLVEQSLLGGKPMKPLV